VIILRVCFRRAFEKDSLPSEFISFFQVQKPKSYEEYIIKKIHIARVIGILDADED
jgi:hypothetical protein